MVAETDDLLGARWDGTGTRFSILSRHASAVELCLFEGPDSSSELRRITLKKSGLSTWEVYLPDVGPGTFYGYRVDGAFAPQEGHRFNRSKLLVDPYALAVTGEPRPDPSIFGFPPGQNPDFFFDGSSSAGVMPKAVVVDRRFDWQGVCKPQVPWQDTIVYETHVKGLTRLHPEVPEEQRGKYLGLISEPILAHLKRLGVTTIEFLPLCQFASEVHLLEAGRSNYWGYSPLAFLAPHAAYASGAVGEQVTEIKTMVRELHRNGLEVVVDMVFNHTAEGGAAGPTLSLKGIDNRTYYRLDPRRPHRYVDFTGCGNTLDIRQPEVLRLVLDVLRYWADELQVDGFRLDLAPVLGRDGAAFKTRARFFEAVAQDPLLRGLKWIAEPWDIGPGGYQLGAFPRGFTEWNDRYRNTVRRFWRGEARGELSGELASRLAGSRDLFGDRAPTASLNYICSHDGFTLADLVSYERKHNEANGEDNRDGMNESFSRNWGFEGPSPDPEIQSRRRRARINMIATLMVSLGVPMIAHGDEIGRSQGGNNNPYCQDNPVTWVDWRKADGSFFDQVARLIALRKRLAVVRSPGGWHAAGSVDGPDSKARVHWFGLRGEPLGQREWSSPDHATFGLHLEGPAATGDDGVLVLINGGPRAANFRLPARIVDRRITLLVYSAWPVTPNSSAIGLADWTMEELSIAIFAVAPSAFSGREG